MTGLSAKIAQAKVAAQAAGLLRARVQLTQTASSPNQFSCEAQHYLNFSSNDYLGLSVSPQLIDALVEGARRYGVGSGASPLVTGYGDAHAELESSLCKATGHEAALLFCSGFSANSALMKTLFGTGDTVVADKLIHASLIDGLRESGATLRRFSHNDLPAAQRLIKAHQPLALVTESVFSMDGDVAPLSQLYKTCTQQGSWLIVDDAHGFGVLSAQQQANAQNCDIQVVTFGKALGGQGAAILGSRACIDFLVANARDYIYSTALSPSAAYVVNCAVSLAIETGELQQKLSDNIAYFKALCQQSGVAITESNTPIQPIIVGKLESLQRVFEYLKRSGIWVGAIRPPTVPKGSARLRITLNVNHSHSQIDMLVSCLASALSSER